MALQSRGLCNTETGPAMFGENVNRAHTTHLQTQNRNEETLREAQEVTGDFRSPWRNGWWESRPLWGPIILPTSINLRAFWTLPINPLSPQSFSRVLFLVTKGSLYHLWTSHHLKQALPLDRKSSWSTERVNYWLKVTRSALHKLRQESPTLRAWNLFPSKSGGWGNLWGFVLKSILFGHSTHDSSGCKWKKNPNQDHVNFF